MLQGNGRTPCFIGVYNAYKRYIWVLSKKSSMDGSEMTGPDNGETHA